MNFNLIDIEKRTIIAAFIYHRADRNRTAKALGLPRSTFYKKVKEYGVNLTSIELEYKFVGYKNHTSV